MWWLIRCFGEVSPGGWTPPSLPEDLWFIERMLAESGVLARRAAGRSPRREPWEQEHSHGPAPEGRHSRATFHAACASDATTVSPFQGFQPWLSDSPTAHAVRYDLPPSGLKTETLRTLSSQETDFCGKGRPKSATSPKYRMSQCCFSGRTPPWCPLPNGRIRVSSVFTG